MKIIDDISNFIYISNKIEKSDIIFIPGSSFKNLALKAAELYKQGYSSKILPSGRYSILEHSFNCDGDKKFSSEYEYLRDILLENNVPQNDILKEDNARNTYENSLKSREVTDRLGMNIKKAIIVCKSFHARRCFMYYSLAYPETEFFICPVDYNNISKNSWFNTSEGIKTVLGEVERCGWQFKEILISKTKQK